MTSWLISSHHEQGNAMYSIKPGRGPSLGSAVGGVIAAVFGVFWTIAAASMGAPGFFVFFGIVFVFVGIGRAIYAFYNATSPNRFSEYDITTHDEESDPLSDAFGRSSLHRNADHPAHHDRHPDIGAEPRKYEGDYCPFCGSAVQPDFDFCPKCGKDI